MVELYEKDNIMTGGGMGDYSLGATYGLKDEKDNVVLGAKYKSYTYDNGVYVFADNALYCIDKPTKYIDAVYYNKHGKKLTDKKINEGYNFNEDGFAVVAPSELNYGDGSKYVLMTKKGFISQHPVVNTEDAKLFCPADLEQAIKDCGAVAVKYATPEVLVRENSEGASLKNYKEALKDYLTNLDYYNKSERECKKIIKAELKLLKKLVNEKLVVAKKEEKERLKKQAIKDYIETL